MSESNGSAEGAKPGSSESGSNFSRRNFVVGGGVAAAGFSLFGLSGNDRALGAPSMTAQPQDLASRPNFLVIVVDEYRFPVRYETDELREFRSTHLTAEQSLRTDGLEFTNHYIMASACVPSRTSIFTGQYPSLHGVTQTTGAAKNSFEDDVFWLDPNTVPTMGNYFRAGGYATYIKGKWHLSEADMTIPGTHDQLLSFDQQGNPDPVNEAAYLGADRLDPFGFSGWIGPEPHGSNPLNSGSSATDAIGRDEKYADQAVDLIDQLAGQTGTPWLVVNTFVNPHDITTWGVGTLANPSWNLLGQLEGSEVPQEPFDEALYTATSGEDLAGKPTCQQSYVDTYPTVFQPTPNTPDYHRLYYQLQQNVNDQIQRVLDALASHPEMAANTIVVFTADHGTQLGAHGGMFQKWHQAYEETTHVPFIINSPTLIAGGQTIDVPTSHADLVPTLLGLAGLDPVELQEALASTHNEVHPFVGRDLSPWILGDAAPATMTDPVFFMTDDEFSRGSNQVSSLNRMYESVVQPNHVETVIALLPTGAGGGLEKWKYSRYSDKPQFWSNPANTQTGTAATDIVTIINGDLTQDGPKTAVTTVKDQPVPDELEAYNLASDPLELTNLAASTDPDTMAVLAQLEELLQQQCATKQLTPSSGTVPSQSTDCDVPTPPPTTTTTSTSTTSTTSTSTSTSTSSTLPTSSSTTSTTGAAGPSGGASTDGVGAVVATPRYAS